jgi:TetR/AcrR family acrAB operon transcriptional repressor
METRCRLLDSAEQLFSRSGVSHTSLADIADAAGVTRGAIYGHFRNKADLFNAMLDRTQLPLEDLIASVVNAAEPDPLGAIQRVMLVCLRDSQCDEHRRLVFDIVFNRCELVDEMGPVLCRIRENARDGISNIELGLINAKSRHQLPDSLDVRLAASMLHAQIAGLIRNSMLVPQRFDFVRDGERMVAAAFDMLRHARALRTGGVGAGVRRPVNSHASPLR